MPRTLTTLFTVLILTFSSTLSADPEGTIIFLVRHAEKTDQAENPALTAEGEQRAEDLASMLADAGISGIHSTDFARTRDTAKPLAERLGLTVQLYDPAEPGALLARLKGTAGRHLVVGHSNPVPDLVGRLGGTPGPAIDEAREHDRLYLVLLDTEGAASTVLLRYGRAFNP